MILRVDDLTLSKARFNDWLGIDNARLVSDLGVTAHGIERVQFVGYDDLPDTSGFGWTMQSRIAEAELWNFH